MDKEAAPTRNKKACRKAVCILKIFIIILIAEVFVVLEVEVYMRIFIDPNLPSQEPVCTEGFGCIGPSIIRSIPIVIVLWLHALTYALLGTFIFATRYATRKPSDGE